MEITYREIFGFVTVLQSILIYVPYIRLTIKGKLRPHPITWIVSCLSGGSNGIILLMNGAGAGAWGNLFTAICTFTLAIFAWKNYKKGGKVSRRDWIFLGLAVLALILWFCSRSLAAASVILLSISSIFGAVPTLAKTWKKPKSENLYTWIMFFIQGICGMVATTKFDFVNLFRRCVVISINAAVIFTMIYRRRKNATLSEDEILANS